MAIQMFSFHYIILCERLLDKVWRTPSLDIESKCYDEENKLIQTFKAYGYIPNPRNKNMIKTKWESVPKETWMVVYDTDYENYSLEGDKDKKYMWILSRHPEMCINVIEGLLIKAMSLGFDVDPLEIVPNSLTQCPMGYLTTDRLRERSYSSHVNTKDINEDEEEYYDINEDDEEYYDNDEDDEDSEEEYDEDSEEDDDDDEDDNEDEEDSEEYDEDDDDEEYEEDDRSFSPDFFRGRSPLQSGLFTGGGAALGGAVGGTPGAIVGGAVGSLASDRPLPAAIGGASGGGLGYALGGPLGAGAGGFLGGGLGSSFR